MTKGVTAGTTKEKTAALARNEKLRAAVCAARRVTVLSGAGISAESGLSTFRGTGGFWERRDLQRLAAPEGFAENPELVWRWYAERREKGLNVAPNAGHYALVNWEEKATTADGGLTVVTQNVDGLHQRAGSRDVVEVHGSLWITRCTRCGREREERAVPDVLPPRCGKCGALERPGVVWFGEMLPPEAMRRADEAVASCDLFLAVGTSAVVYPAASWSARARARGAFVIEVNPEETPISDTADCSLRGRSGEILPALVALLGSEK